MFIKIHKSYRYVVAICDSELIGKIFQNGKFQLDVKENFYKGDRVDEKEAIKIMEKMAREDATFNIIGKNSVNTALKAGIITPEGVNEIQGIPFAFVLL
jgi:uncharacterized protein